MKRGAQIGGILLGAKECVGPPEAEVQGKEGVSRRASGGGMALLPLDFRPLASRSARGYISADSSHPIYCSVFWQHKGRDASEYKA